MADISTKGSLDFELIDGENNVNRARVNSSGQLLVVTPPPEPPIGTTGVSITEFDDVGGNNAEFNYYTIPSGETLVIQRLQGGSEGTTDESQVILWYDPTGVNATGDEGNAAWTLITVGYVANSNFQFDIDDSFVGDGTGRIVLHRRRLDGGTRQIFGKWRGYY